MKVTIIFTQFGDTQGNIVTSRSTIPEVELPYATKIIEAFVKGAPKLTKNNHIKVSTCEVKPICIGCGKTPGELPEYCDAAADSNVTPDEYVRKEEGTYNKANGHFMCTICYIMAGSPSSPYGWVAP